MDMVHLLHYPAVLSFQCWRWIFWVVFFWIWKNRCYPRRLAFGKIFSRFLKIILRSCLHTEDPLPHFYGIEIPLHDDFLVPNFLNHESKNRFQALSQPASIIPKENIFGCLLEIVLPPWIRFPFSLFSMALSIALKSKPSCL